MPQIDNLLQFLNASPSSWHAVDAMRAKLETAGFKSLQEGERWQLQPNGRYFVIRNGSALCAFVVPAKALEKASIVLSHTDSPGFKLKPNAEFHKDNMIMLGVEVYGAPLMTSWLNRDLGIAGRVIYSKQGQMVESLVRIDKSPVVLPQLAIHLDRQVNEEGLLLNKQELAVIAGLSDGSNKSLLAKHLQSATNGEHILGADLFLFPLEPAAYIGSNKQMVASYRIDNLCSVLASLEGITKEKNAPEHQLNMMAAVDNEEIGSETAQGAASPFVAHVLERIALALKVSREDYLRLLTNSLCISADMAHATHPNYADRHEPRHAIHLERGIAIKYNAQFRYASDGRSAAKIVDLCHELKIPYQNFVTRGNIPCGTTVGPIHAQKTGMPTVDIGIPQLSMHSCRELIATQDYLSLCRLLEGFFS